MPRPYNRTTFAGGPRYEASDHELYQSRIKCGEKVCRECGTSIDSGSRRQSWCSRECVDAYVDRKRPVREIIWERDHGICALCGKQCGQGFWGSSKWEHEWEADHIIPLVEGGAHAEDNVRTLCISCHRSVTRDLRSRLAEARK